MAGNGRDLFKNLKRNIYNYVLAYRHTETPWYANAFSLLIEQGEKKWC